VDAPPAEPALLAKLLSTAAEPELALRHGSVVAAPELSEPLAPGHVRVRVRAAGMNFRDVLVALGEIGSPGIGFEFAGVVDAVGAGVTSVSVGDRVFGCGLGCFGTRAVTPAHLVAKV